jgi:Cft2 family RNA processing exonuclease
MANWQVESRNGIWLPQINWWLDAHRPAPRSFVSHAHADHVARHGESICTPITAALIRTRDPYFKGTPREVEFNRPVAITPTATLTLVPAGHVLGSAQALIEHAEFGRLLYTGDFKLRPSATAETCATPKADTLIMETTFAQPRYVFPPHLDVFKNILSFCRESIDSGDIPILLGYSLGRSQEILAGLADADLSIMLHPQVEKVTRTYERFGCQFPPYSSFAPLFASGHVVITPSQALKSELFSTLQRRRTAVVTGWAIDESVRYRYGCDAAFPLSDHAGFDDLLKFVDAVQPRRVFTVHGFAQEFAAVLRQRGIEAWALGRTNQLELPL